MSYEEKFSWTYMVLAVVMPLAYVGFILNQYGNQPVTEIPYQVPLLVTIAATIVLAILAAIAIGIADGIRSPKTAGKSDQRDKDINRHGEYVGGIVLGTAMLLPFGLGLAEVEHFWVVNTMYAGFTLAAIIGSRLKIVAYRRGF